jgi:hypothetical protein
MSRRAGAREDVRYSIRDDSGTLRKVPLPSPPLVQVQTGRVSLVGVVPLPPDAEAPTLPLRIALAYQVFLLVVGEHRQPGWYEVAAVFPADDLHTLLPDETGEWRLAGEVEPVRAVWVRALGLASDQQD